MSAFSSHLIRQAGPADAAWIADFLRQRWNATTIVVHGESFDAVSLPALIADNHKGLATYRLLGHDAELVTLDATPANNGTGSAIIDALVAQLCQSAPKSRPGSASKSMPHRWLYLACCPQSP
jgi:hypothetical protein